MAGVISPSMPVWIVADREHGNRAYCNLNEGLGKVLRFGANGPEVHRAPALDAPTCWRRRSRPRSRSWAGSSCKPLIAQALHMGDEVHNRNVAASSLLLKRLVPALLQDQGRAGRDRRGRRLHRRQRSLLPQPLDGGVQGDARCRRGRARQQHGDRDGAQRRRVRHPAERHRRRLVHGTRAGRRWPAVPRLHERRRGARPRRQRDHRDRGPRRLRDGGRARDRAVRRRHAAGRDRQHASR